MTRLWRAAFRLGAGSVEQALRRTCVAGLVLLVAMGLGPAMSCGQGASPAPAMLSASSHDGSAMPSTHAHGASAEHRFPDGAPTHAASTAQPRDTSQDAGHAQHADAASHIGDSGKTAHGSAPPCCHPGCPACLATLPGGPSAPRAIPERVVATVAGAPAMPAGIAIPPPLAPPKTA